MIFSLLFLSVVINFYFVSVCIIELLMAVKESFKVYKDKLYSKGIYIDNSVLILDSITVIQ